MCDLYFASGWHKGGGYKISLGSVGVEDLMALAKPFGTVVKHLVFPCKVSSQIDKKNGVINTLNS